VNGRGDVIRPRSFAVPVGVSKTEYQPSGRPIGVAAPRPWAADPARGVFARQNVRRLARPGCRT
jgi:hypothetical protein